MAEAWSQDLEDELVRLHGLGLPFGLIGQKLGKSRNSCIAKINRLGLSDATPEARRARTTLRKKRALVPPAAKSVWPNDIPRPNRNTVLSLKSPRPPVYHKKPDLAVPVAQRKVLVDLEPGDCRWPYGDPQKPDFYFCAGKGVPGKPYCAFHAIRSAPPAEAVKRVVAKTKKALEKA